VDANFVMGTDDRNFDMVNADDGSVLGNCVLDQGDDYQCSTGISATDGTRLFICTSDITAEDINAR
jgi:hypothetical protein